MDKLKWIKDRRHICISPSTQYNFRIDQSKFKITCCCNLDVSKTSQEADFKFIDTLAESMLQGNTNSACKRCYSDEDRNLMSERIRYLLDYPESVLLQLEQTSINEFTIGMKFSNLCNSACRSCSQYDSSLWSSTFGVPASSLLENDLSDNPVYWQHITSAILKKYKELSEIESFKFYINVIGGETLLQKGFYKLIDWLIDQGIASSIILRITTGLTVSIDKDTAIKLLKFKKIVFNLSIDTVGENFQYVRWPTKFSKIETMLADLNLLYVTNPTKIELRITPVFSINNIFYIKDYLDWWLSWMTAHQQLVISPINLYQPQYFDLCILPDPYRQNLLDILQSLNDHPLFLLKECATIKSHLYLIMEVLSSTPGNDGKFIHYLTKTATMDKITNITSNTGNKKLFDLLTIEHRQIYERI
jgi:hypothetical protein